MATSGVVLRETGDFYALPCRTVNETCAHFRALIQVQPIKTRMCHVTRIWSVSGWLPSPSGDKPDTLQIAMI